MNRLQKMVTLILLTIALISGNSFAEIEFDQHIIETLDYGHPKIFRPVDLDDDGDMDIVGSFVTSENSDQTFWYENDGNQNFTFHTINYVGCEDFHIIDFDLDGDLDLLAGTQFANDSDVLWFENDGNQSFSTHLIQDNFNGLKGVYAADIDGDNDMDALAVKLYDNNFYWWENDGEQNFTSHFLGVDCHQGLDVSAVDLDNDGDMDIVGAIWALVVWFENEGAQDFTIHEIPGDYTANRIFPADLDDDGDMDIVVGNGESSVWLQNDGNQNFNAIEYVDSDGCSRNICVVDLDRDGDNDILGGDQWDPVQWFENDGNQNFTRYSISMELAAMASTRAADIDGDGDLDVVASGYNEGILLWLENVCTTLPPGPFSLISPAYPDTVWDSDTTFLWHLAVNPDGESPSYNVWLANEADLEDATLVVEEIEDTTFTVTNLVDDEVYYWTVHATDDNTVGTWANDTLSFSTYFPETMGEFDLIAPEDGLNIYDVSAFPLNFTWEESTDPDPNDVLTYTLEISTDEGFTDPQLYTATEATEYSISDLEINEYWWRVKASDLYGFEVYSTDTRSLIVTLDVDDILGNGVPSDFSIQSTYPNPFNSRTMVTIGLPVSSELRVSVYNISGREVLVLEDNVFTAGRHEFTFDAEGLSSGIYFINAFVPGQMNEMRKVVLIK